MNGFELGGMNLRVTKALVGGPMPEGMKALDKMPPAPAQPVVPASVVAAAMSINSSIGEWPSWYSPYIC